MASAFRRKDHGFIPGFHAGLNAAFASHHTATAAPAWAIAIPAATAASTPVRKGGAGSRQPKGLNRNNVVTLAADASRRAALLVAYILPVCALPAPCRAGASTPKATTLFRFEP